MELKNEFNLKEIEQTIKDYLSKEGYEFLDIDDENILAKKI